MPCPHWREPSAAQRPLIRETAGEKLPARNIRREDSGRRAPADGSVAEGPRVRNETPERGQGYRKVGSGPSDRCCRATRLSPTPLAHRRGARITPRAASRRGGRCCRWTAGRRRRGERVRVEPDGVGPRPLRRAAGDCGWPQTEVREPPDAGLALRAEASPEAGAVREPLVDDQGRDGAAAGPAPSRIAHGPNVDRRRARTEVSRWPPSPEFCPCGGQKSADSHHLLSSVRMEDRSRPMPVIFGVLSVLTLIWHLWSRGHCRTESAGFPLPPTRSEHRCRPAVQRSRADTPSRRWSPLRRGRRATGAVRESL